ncbi:MAG: GAF domain-containing protein [Thermomicrobiales bacterium]|nr:GAF domain-containing protein [Thermomicrobiales bacterium]
MTAPPDRHSPHTSGTGAADSECAEMHGADDQPGAWFVVDDRQRIVEWGAAAETFLAIPPEAALGQPCYAVVGGFDPFGRGGCCPGCRAIEAIRAGRLTAGSTLAIGRRGSASQLRCEVHALPRSTGGAIVHLSPRAAPEHPASPVSDMGSPLPVADLLGNLSALVTLTTSLAGSNVLDRLDETLDLVRELTLAESAELFLAEPDGGDLLLTAYRGPFRRAFFQRVRFATGEGFPGLAAARHQTVLTDALPDDPRYLRDEVKERGFRTYLCAPLVANGSALGAISIGARRADIHLKDTLRLLTWVSAPIAAALQGGLLQACRHAMPSAIPFRGDDGDLDLLLRDILSRARQAAAADGGTIALFDRNTGDVVRRISDTAAGPTCLGFACSSSALACPALGFGHGVALCGSRQAWPVPCRRLRRPGSTTYCVPMRAEGVDIGLVQLVYDNVVPSPPTRHLGMLLEIAAQDAAIVAVAQGFVREEHHIRTASPCEAPWSAAPARMASKPDITQLDESVAAHQDVPTPFLAIRCLGSFSLSRDGALLPPEAFQRRQALTLLKILLLHAGRTVPRETLIEHLWPESDPERAVRRLHVVVHALREVVEPDPSNRQWSVIKSGADGYAFDPSVSCWTDLTEFRAAIAIGRRAEERGDAVAAAVAYD